MMKKVSDLKRMNKDGGIPSLDQSQQATEYQFEQAAQLCEQLEDKLSDFTGSSLV